MEKAGALAGSNFVCGTIEGIFTAPLQASPPDGADTEAATSAVDQQASRAATVPRAVGNTATTGKVVSRVRIDGQEHEADVVVVALGPWSNLAAAWLPLPMAVSGQKYHSAVLAPSDPVRYPFQLRNMSMHEGSTELFFVLPLTCLGGMQDVPACCRVLSEVLRFQWNSKCWMSGVGVAGFSYCDSVVHECSSRGRWPPSRTRDISTCAVPGCHACPAQV